MTNQTVIQTVIDAVVTNAPYAPTKQSKAKVVKTKVKEPLTEQQILDAAALRSKLSVGRWIVEFTKVDGSLRVMECTRDSKLIPQTATEKEQTEKAESMTIRVFDLDKSEWRSFRMISLQKMYRVGENL